MTALTPNARAWCERFGFRPLDEADGLDLYLMTKDVEATLRTLS